MTVGEEEAMTWRWDGPHPHEDCECPCSTCVEAIGMDYEQKCPWCPVHGRMTDEELDAEWEARNARLD